RSRRPAAGRRMGRADRRWQELHEHRLVDLRLSGDCHRAHRPRLQPGRRWDRRIAEGEAMTETANGDVGLVVRGLTTTFDTPHGLAVAAADVDFDVAPGEVVGLVGESGSGKSVTLRSIMRLIREPGRVSGRVDWRGRDLVAMSAEELRRIRGSEIAM